MLLVGAGGLGGPIAHALAAAGARLWIFDGDVVEPSNLHRQVQFALADVGRPKASTLAAKLCALGAEAVGVDRKWADGGGDADSEPGSDSDAEPGSDSDADAEPGSDSDVEPGSDSDAEPDADAEPGSAPEPDFDLIIDGSDDPATKFAVADWAARRALPSVIAGALGLSGNVFLSAPGRACFRCLFEEPPDEAPTCADAGVLGPVVASVGALAALAALELAAGRHELGGAIWILDGGLAAPAQARRVALSPRPGCPSCAQAPLASAGRPAENQAAWPPS